MSQGLKSQKNIASRILKCGTTRVWLDPAREGDISEAITAEDVRSLIKEKIIRVLPKKGLSSFRKKKKALQKSKGRRKGHGSRKGKANARNSTKKVWIKNIRGMRRKLKDLRDSKAIEIDTYKNVYKKSKGGFFRNKNHMVSYLERNNMLKVKEDVQEKKK